MPVDPATVKYLRILVTVLTGTMIVGFLVIVTLFVIKFSGGTGPNLPETISLPDGAKATAFTQGDDWFAVVTDGRQILIFDRGNGRLRQTVILE